MAGISSHGTTFSFRGATLLVTSVSVDYGQERTRVPWPHMGMLQDAREPFHLSHKTEENLPVIAIDFVTGAIPAIQSTGALSITGAVAFSGTATCISSVVRGAVGDLVRGTASFRVA